MQAFKSSQLPFAYIQLINVMMHTPLFMRDYLLGDYTNKLTFVWSNVPGFKNPLVVNNKKAKVIGFYPPAIKALIGQFGLISYVDRLKLGICMDKVAMQDPKEFREYYHKNLD